MTSVTTKINIPGQIATPMALDFLDWNCLFMVTKCDHRPDLVGATGFRVLDGAIFRKPNNGMWIACHWEEERFGRQFCRQTYGIPLPEGTSVTLTQVKNADIATKAAVAGTLNPEDLRWSQPEAQGQFAANFEFGGRTPRVPGQYYNLHMGERKNPSDYLDVRHTLHFNTEGMKGLWKVMQKIAKFEGWDND